jgi:hypothetical protein
VEHGHATWDKSGIIAGAGSNDDRRITPPTTQAIAQLLKNWVQLQK